MVSTEMAEPKEKTATETCNWSHFICRAHTKTIIH